MKSFYTFLHLFHTFPTPQNPPPDFLFFSCFPIMSFLLHDHSLSYFGFSVSHARSLSQSWDFRVAFLLYLGLFVPGISPIYILVVVTPISTRKDVSLSLSLSLRKSLLTHAFPSLSFSLSVLRCPSLCLCLSLCFLVPSGPPPSSTILHRTTQQHFNSSSWSLESQLQPRQVVVHHDGRHGFLL